MNETVVTRVGDELRVTFPDGAVSRFPGNTDQSVIAKHVQDQLREKQLWRPSVRVNLGDKARQESVTEEAKSRGGFDQFLSGVGSAAQLARGALTQERPLNDKFDMFNEALVQFNPVSRAISASQDLLRPPPGAIVENKALATATPLTRAGNAAGNVAISALLPVGMRAGYMGSQVAPSSFLGGLADTALTQGAITSAITPGTPEERTNAGVLSAGTSAALPIVTGAVQGGRRMMTTRGKELKVGSSLLEELGDQADDLERVLRSQARESQLLGTRPSAAALTRNPTLQGLEAGSRVTRPDAWITLDQENAAARWAALNNAAGTPESRQGLRLARDAQTAPMRDDAIDTAVTSMNMARRGGINQSESWPIVNRLENLKMSANPDARKLGKYVEDSLSRTGGSPQGLYEIRKFLTDGYRSGPNSKLANAVKGANAERRALIESIDSTLNSVSGGTWSDYLARYRAESPAINSKDALGDIIESLTRNQPVGAVPTAMNTGSATVGGLLTRFGQKQLGTQTVDNLLPADREIVENIVSSIANQVGGMSHKATVGSPTAGLLSSATRADNLAANLAREGGGMLAADPISRAVTTGLLSRLSSTASQKQQDALVRLLQDPVALANAIAAARRGQNITTGANALGAAFSRPASQETGLLGNR